MPTWFAKLLSKSSLHEHSKYIFCKLHLDLSKCKCTLPVDKHYISCKGVPSNYVIIGSIYDLDVFMMRF